MVGTGERRVAGGAALVEIAACRPGGWSRQPAGLVGLYAARADDRCVDLRPLLNERRAAMDGPVGWSASRRPAARPAIGAPLAVGRGTAEHQAAVRGGGAPPAVPRVARRNPFAQRGARSRPGVRRRLVAAGLAVLVVLAGAAGTGLAQEAPAVQHRYVVQAGDSLDSVSSAFGVDPAAILAASALSNPPALTPAEVIVIPGPGQTPAEAAALAAEREGSSPWVAGVYEVAAGDTLADVAAGFGLDAATLAEFNGLADPDALAVGQRLRVPPTREEVAAELDQGGELAPAIAGEPAWAASVPADLPPVPDPTSLGAFVAGVPTYVQQRSLSCEYAAAYIATSAFGAGVPEWVFLENVPAAANPHWGYRGDVDGLWGNTVDYGVYPEALVPTLNANGFGADVFYSGGDPAALRVRLDRGLPVAVWLGFWGDTSFYDYAEDGTPFKLAAGYHVVVAYGYDEGGVHVSDPARGEYRYFGWDDFAFMWGVLDGMAMAVYPL